MFDWHPEYVYLVSCCGSACGPVIVPVFKTGGRQVSCRRCVRLTLASDNFANENVPMNNREIQAAWKYHVGSKPSFWSIRNNPHFLDWANRPLPFKIYPKIDPIPLPRDIPQTGVAALSAISAPLIHCDPAATAPEIIP